MDEQRRNLYAEFVLRYRESFEQKTNRAAIIVGENDTIYAGIDQIIPDSLILSPIYNIIFKLPNLLNKYTLFSTYFPHTEDFRLLLCTTIRSIYFWGEPDDSDTVSFLNMYNKQMTNPFEMTRLKK